MRHAPNSVHRQIARPFYGLLGVVVAAAILGTLVWVLSHSRVRELRTRFESFHMTVALSTLEASGSATGLEQSIRDRSRLPSDDVLARRAVDRAIDRKRLALQRAMASIVEQHVHWQRSPDPFGRTVDRAVRQHEALERSASNDRPDLVDVESRIAGLKLSLDQLDRLHSVHAVELMERIHTKERQTRERVVLVMVLGLLVAGSLMVRILLQARARIREHEQTQLLLDARDRQLRQASKMEALGSLAGGVAHDFNNLLTAILGNVDPARAAMGSSERGLKALGEIEKAGERAAGLTRQLLAFGRRELADRRTVDLDVLIRELLPLLRRLIRADIRLELRLEASDTNVKVDPAQIEQALINLVVNAKDAMEDGGVLTVETSNVRVTDADVASLLPGDYVRVVVSDTGCGMTAETISRAFDPFFTTKEPGRGTGLGLASVHGLIAKNEGHVQVHSEVGTGTRFEIFLGRCDEPVSEPRGRSRRAPVVRGTETILVAEDDPQVRRLLVDGLQGAGYGVLAASDGNEALLLYTENVGTVHLIITDVVMPGMRGPEWVERALALDSYVRVIYISGYAEDEILPDGTAGGAQLITKPFRLQGLLDSVRRELDRVSSAIGVGESTG